MRHTKSGLIVNIKRTMVMSTSNTNPIEEGVKDILKVITDFIFFDSKIHKAGDCSDEINICLLLGRKPITNVDQKKKYITVPAKGICRQSHGLSSCNTWL